MKKIFLICLILLIGNKKSQAQTIAKSEYKDLIGSWEWSNNPNGNDVPEDLFTLNIEKINGNNLLAQYCAIAYSGNRIDCTNEEEFNVKGTISGNKISATFYSFFGAKNGVVEITINGNSLAWKIKTKPQKGNYYAPNNCVLKKSKVSDIGIEGWYILKSCEKSRFKIKIEKNKTNYNYSIVDKTKTILRGKVIVNKNQIKFGKIEGVISDNNIIIQNYGNSMNEYIHFTQCDEKYLTFEKVKL